MTRITLDLIRKKSEHNECRVSTLEEIALHQLNIEKIEALGILCRHLKIIYLQNNLIGKLKNLHKLKELEYLNVALNNIKKIQNLQRCESLKKLDMTLNFVPISGLCSLHTLQNNYRLEELYLVGNPCAQWEHYKQFVIATLPQIKSLDGDLITPSSRIRANQEFQHITQILHELVRSEGLDPAVEAQVEDDGEDVVYDEIEETGYIDAKGDMVRPWCAETRILDHREQEAKNKALDEAKKQNSNSLWANEEKQVRREDFPEVQDPQNVQQRNEGEWEYTLDESDAGGAITLDVDVGLYLDTSLIKIDVQTWFARLLIKGKLLQLQLPAEVRPDSSIAQRSKLTGSLVLTMPLEHPDLPITDIAHMKPREGTKHGKQVRKALQPIENKPPTNTLRSKSQITTISAKGKQGKGDVGNRDLSKQSDNEHMQAVREAQIVVDGDGQCATWGDELPPLL